MRKDKQGPYHTVLDLLVLDLILSSGFIWVVSKIMSFLTFVVLKVHCGKEAF